ncbi:hypothetical protein A2U01_0092195, partial [Trifolium medium]|nr:hypothetical protein [Trifolium medium]
RFVVFELPSAKPSDIELLLVASEIEVSQASMVETQLPPKSPDVGQSATAHSRREPPPKPQDLNKSVDRERE